MLDNSFQSRYNKLPIATYAISEPPLSEAKPFMHLHHHSEFEVIVILSGQCHVTIDQIEYNVSGGDILLIPPYSIHSGYILPYHAFSHFCFCFDSSLLHEPELCRQLETGYIDVQRVVSRVHSNIGLLRNTAHHVYLQCESREKGWDLLVRGALLFFFGALQQAELLFPTANSASHCDFGTQVLDILGRTYSTNVTSRHIAAEMSYSQSYFCRLFRENFSSSFQQYLCRYRLNKARLLLAQSDVSVSVVALRVGFGNFSYFSKQFREMYGCTPKQFQKLQTPSQEIHGRYEGTMAHILHLPEL